MRANQCLLEHAYLQVHLKYRIQISLGIQRIQPTKYQVIITKTEHSQFITDYSLKHEESERSRTV